MCVCILGDEVVTWIAHAEIGGSWVEGLNRNFGCQLRNGVKTVVARGHGLTDCVGVRHFWWRKKGYDGYHYCVRVHERW